MNVIVMKILSGCACILLLKEILVVKCDSCPISDYQGLKGANCSEKSFNEVPQDLDASIEYLDISYMTFSDFTEKSLQRYPNLISLSLQHSVIQGGKLDVNILRSLNYLEILNMENLKLFEPKAPLYWPLNLKIMRLSQLSIQDLDVSKLIYLEQLNASHNNLRYFPFVSEYAPLRYVNIEENPIHIMSVEMIAPFCHLSKIEIKPTDTAMILDETRFCVCQRINAWAKYYSIDITELNCKSSTPDYQCDISFSSDVKSLRSDCFTNTSGTFKYLTYLIIFMVLSTIVAVGVYTHRDQFKFAANNTEANVSIDNEWNEAPMPDQNSENED